MFPPTSADVTPSYIMKLYAVYFHALWHSRGQRVAVHILSTVLYTRWYREIIAESLELDHMITISLGLLCDLFSSLNYSLYYIPYTGAMSGLVPLLNLWCAEIIFLMWTLKSRMAGSVFVLKASLTILYSGHVLAREERVNGRRRATSNNGKSEQPQNSSARRRRRSATR